MIAAQKLIDDVKYFKDYIIIETPETQSGYCDINDPFYIKYDEINNLISQWNQNPLHIKNIAISKIPTQTIGTGKINHRILITNH